MSGENVSAEHEKEKPVKMKNKLWRQCHVMKKAEKEGKKEISLSHQYISIYLWYLSIKSNEKYQGK